MTTYKEKVRSTELANKAKLAEVNVFFIVVLVSAINARGKNVFFLPNLSVDLIKRGVTLW